LPGAFGARYFSRIRAVVVSGFEKTLRFNSLEPALETREKSMKANQDLIGKTITGAVAVTRPGEAAREIWLLQFSDGTHVEFVSPQGRRRIRSQAKRKRTGISGAAQALQLALNVA